MELYLAAKHLQEYTLSTILIVRRNHPSMLFTMRSRKSITYTQLLNTLKQTLKLLHRNPDFYGLHSFCTGLATQMYMGGFTNEEIKKAGRWSSNAFKTYLRPNVADNMLDTF